MKRIPHRIVPAYQKCAVEDTAGGGQPGGIGVPYSGLDTDGLHPGVAQSRGQWAISVSDIKPEIGHVSNIQSGLGLIAPLEVQRLTRFAGIRGARQIEAAPSLVVQAAPGAAVENARSALGN